MSNLTVAEIMSRRVFSVRGDARLTPASLLRKMRRFRHLPVVDAHERPIGVLSRSDVLEQALATGTGKGPEIRKYMTAPADVAQLDEVVEVAARRMLDEGVHALPVIDEGGRLAGIVTDTDLLGAIASERARPPEPAEVPVDLVMSDEPATLAPTDTLADAARAMLEAQVRHLPVVDDDRRVVGILSERDLRLQLGVEVLRFTEAPNAKLDTPVEDAMTENPISARSGTHLADAVEALVGEKVGALPVVDGDDRLIGILSYVDVLQWLRGALAGRSRISSGRRRAERELHEPAGELEADEPEVGDVARTIARGLTEEELQEIRNTGTAEELRAAVRQREQGHGWTEREVDACIDAIERLVLPHA